MKGSEGDTVRMNSGILVFLKIQINYVSVKAIRIPNVLIASFVLRTTASG